MLTSKQRAYLRSLAVNEDTILMIGKGGIDGDVVKQAADAIFKRELIKGKVLETAPVSPREAAEALAEQTESEVVQVIGSKFALYKRNEKDPKIVLPRAKKALAMRIGIYGGTFNPIHTAHVHLVREFIKRLSLDRVILIPTGTPPHKAACKRGRPH